MKYAVSIFALALFLLWYGSLADEEIFTVTPKSPLQGEAFMVRIDHVPMAAVESLSFGSTSVPVFYFEGRPVALIAVDLAAATGTRPLQLSLASGREIRGSVAVRAREKKVEPLGIPKKLGGDTVASQQRLVASLAHENAILAGLPSAPRALWNESFVMPLSSTTVTDAYGYSRQTGAYSIPHKGADFRAATGTPVLAMNSGVVALVREFRNYGKTLVIDHGLGLQTFSMHLSDFLVHEGDAVEKGEIVALSGDSGYAERPHLHISVRIGGISVDPVAFLALFK